MFVCIQGGADDDRERSAELSIGPTGIVHHIPLHCAGAGSGAQGWPVCDARELGTIGRSASELETTEPQALLDRLGCALTSPLGRNSCVHNTSELSASGLRACTPAQQHRRPPQQRRRCVHLHGNDEGVGDVCKVRCVGVVPHCGHYSASRSKPIMAGRTWQAA
jgi:hypothetical protein